MESYDPALDRRHGFKFEAYDTEAVLAATLQRALTLYRDRAAWERLMQHGMQADFPWCNLPASMPISTPPY